MAILISDKEKVKELRRINKKVMIGDELLSFQEQLELLDKDEFNRFGVFIISPSTKALHYVDNRNVNHVLVMNVVDVEKIKRIHPAGSIYLESIEEKLANSVLAIGSKTREDSIVVILDEMHGSSPIIVSCCFEKEMGGRALFVNQITSIYDKNHFQNFLIETWNMDKPFYKNNKTEHYIQARGLQLPNALIYALSNSYLAQSFTKSQVEKQNNQ